MSTQAFEQEIAARDRLYKPSAKTPEIVDVPPMNFLMVDGTGDPNTSQAYRDALEALYAMAFHEGLSAQIMHIGPYATEAPTIQQLHDFIYAEGGAVTGRHHEIYLGDPRRAAPEKLKTVIRQPFVRQPAG